MALKTNLVSYWKLEETSGTRVDAHGSNDLTDVDTVTSGTGKIDTAADFERTNTEWLTITDAAQSGLDLTSDCSFNLWQNLESLPTGGAQYSYISKFLSTGNQRSYILYLVESAGTITLNFLSYTNGSTGTTKTVTWAPSTATWYMVTMTYTAAAGEVRFYVDGTQLGTTQTGAGTSIFNGTAPFDIGDVNQFGTLGFDGLLDEVSVHSRVLSDSEITEIYNAGAGLSYDSWDAGGATPTYRRSNLTLLGVS